MFVCVLDFEATCWEGRPAKEIIEFPSVLLYVTPYHSVHTVSEFKSFCRPREPLSEFCTKLTGITQAQVDAAPEFPTVLANWTQWLHQQTDGRAVILLTVGEWDLSIAAPNECTRWNIARPSALSQPYVNIKKAFRKHFPHLRSGGMAKMLSELKLPLVGRHHSGIDDCRNTVSILVKMVESHYWPVANTFPVVPSSVSKARLAATQAAAARTPVQVTLQ